MMIKGLLVLCVIVAIASFVNGKVLINEVELNPQGLDSGNEWVEVFNNGSVVNLTEWYLQDVDGNNFSFPGVAVDEKRFFVLDNITGFALVNTDENIKLFDKFHVLIDFTGNLTDVGDDNRTFQRLPDGNGNFTFKNMTKGFPNQETHIQNKSIGLECVLSSDDVELSVQVVGFCVEEVVFYTLIDGIVANNPGGAIGGNRYVLDIDSGLLKASDYVNWSVYVRDCFNRTFKNGNESFFVHSRTNLSVVPENPDGLNEWYVSEPEFTLGNVDASRFFYRWDSADVHNYTSPFGLEDIPNSPVESAGILDLNYWSDVCINEKLQSVDLMVDLKSPEIVGLFPEDGETIFNEKRPVISIFLDEVYQSNSGIDIEIVQMELRGEDSGIIPGSLNVSRVGKLDGLAEFVPGVDLIEGRYNVSVNVSDYAGRSSFAEWFFDVNLSIDEIILDLISPSGGVSGSNRVDVNISLSRNAKILEYMNGNDRRPRFRRLCSDCNSYGFFTKRSVRLNEGLNDLIFRTKDIFGNVDEKNVSIFIDSKAPRISRTFPRRRSVTNGSNFYVRYSEDNVENISLIWNPSKTRFDCESGRNKECVFDIHNELVSGEFDGQTIEFYFVVEDSIYSDVSRTTEVLVDVSVPEIDIVMPENRTYGERKVPFNISVSEDVVLEFIDLNDKRPRYRKLCSRCDGYGDDRARGRRFRDSGKHELVFRATDKAGNAVFEKVEFEVI